MTAAGTPDRPDRKGRGVLPDRPQWETPKGRPPTTEEVTRSYVEMQLVGAGFTDVQAELLADAGCDWHQAVDLLGAGCEPAAVLTILT